MMATPITICDDSSFARKQVTRALPADWDVNIHYAGNGAEALEAIEQGLAEILFLDLTMPVMDGIDVLERLDSLDIPHRVIVISADIQPAMRERVENLGAIAFLQKPVDENQLIQILVEQKLYYGDAAGHRLSARQVERNDWLAEIINVSMGDAAHRLAQSLGCEITLSLPHVSELEPNDVRMLLSTSRTRSQQPLITQGFIGQGVAGECILFVDEMNEALLQNLLQAKHQKTNLQATLYDLASILNGSLLHRLFTQIGTQFHSRPPMTIHHFDQILEMTEDIPSRNKKMLAIEINYTVKSESFSCNQLIIFTHDACQKLDILLRTA